MFPTERIPWYQVPLHAPGTREQWREWTDVHWPLCWRPPEASRPSELASLSEAEVAAMRVGMDAAYGAMGGRPGSRVMTNGAAIVDPATGEASLTTRTLVETHPAQSTLDAKPLHLPSSLI